jgi:polysaccharide biosynthesis transport protein
VSTELSTNGRDPEGALSKPYNYNRAIVLPPPPKDDAVLDIVGVVRTLARRRIWIYGSLAICLALAGVLCLVMTPRYRAEAQIELLKQDVGGLAVSDGSDESARNDEQDALDFSLSLETQVSVLKSDNLGLRVIRELNLAETPDFRYAPLIKTALTRQQMGLPLDQSPLKRAYVLKRWAKNLKVDSVSGTRLISVSYLDRDPQMAARVVNQLLADFVEYNFQVRYNATTKAADWLGGQLVDLKSQVEAAQKKAVDLQRDAGIYGFDESHNVIVSRLDQLNTQVAEAQTALFAKQAVYNLARAGNPELVAGLLGGSSQSGTSFNENPPALLTTLRQQEADLNAQYAEDASKYGSDYPKLVQLRQRLESVRSDIKTETGKVVERARNEYVAAADAEAAATRAFEEQKAVAAEMNNKTIDFTIAKHEADASRELYEHLQQRLKEAGVLAGLHSTNINIVDAAAPPDHPDKPDVPLYLMIAVLSGMTLGVFSAFLRDTLDSSIRNPEEIESATHAPVLGIVPRAELFVGKVPKGYNGKVLLPRNGSANESAGGVGALLRSQNTPVVEAFRAIRTSLLLSRPDHPARIFMVTSALPGEGKTFASLNLAAVFAQNGGRVLLVDADLRRGTLSRNLRQPSTFGLSNLLFTDAEDRAYRQVEEIPGLTFLGAGSKPPYPAESLGSRKMAGLIEKWRQDFDYVVIDSPPVLPVTDAAVLSHRVDGVVVVARFAVSTRQSIIRAIRTLTDVQADCFGVIVNAMDVGSSDYYYYCGSYGNGDYAYGDSGSRPVVPALPAAAGKEKSA